MNRVLSACLFGILMGIGLGIAVGRFLFDEGPYLAPADRSFGVLVEAAVFGLLAGAVILASGAGGEFIYFQF